MRIFLTLLSAFYLAAPAHAQAPKPDSAEAGALAANYELTSADATRKCAMTLEPRATGKAYSLTFDRELCGPLFHFLSEVAGWQPGVAGAILLVGADGRTVAEFTEGVGGVYEAIRENDAVYFLANLQFLDPADRTRITELFGEWNLSPPGENSACRVSLTDTIAGENRFAARAHAGCPETVERFGLAAWRFEQGDIVFLPRSGEPMRFGRNDDGDWAKIPERPNPLVLTRP